MRETNEAPAGAYASVLRAPLMLLPHTTKFEKILWPTIIAPLAAGLLATAVMQSKALAAPRPVYVISDREGYGVVECLTQNHDCGKIVADSWCEAHGHGPAAAFGRADDITASITPVGGKQLQQSGAAIITCSE
jgi:hypothetical protein